MDTKTAPDSFSGPYYPVLECTLHNSRQTWIRQEWSERGSSITELCCVLHELRSRTSPQKRLRLLPLPCSVLLRRIRLDRGHASLRAACFSAFHHCWTKVGPRHAVETSIFFSLHRKCLISPCSVHVQLLSLFARPACPDLVLCFLSPTWIYLPPLLVF